MATTVLPFVIRPRAPSRVRAAGAQATIIIFPGVRYETVEDGEERGSAKRTHSSSRTKRKGKAR